MFEKHTSTHQQNKNDRFLHDLHFNIKPDVHKGFIRLPEDSLFSRHVRVDLGEASLRSRMTRGLLTRSWFLGRPTKAKGGPLVTGGLPQGPVS